MNPSNNDTRLFLKIILISFIIYYLFFLQIYLVDLKKSFFKFQSQITK